MLPPCVLIIMFSIYVYIIHNKTVKVKHKKSKTFKNIKYSVKISQLDQQNMKRVRKNDKKVKESLQNYVGIYICV